MKPRQRPLLIAVSCLALVCPVKVQINTGTRGGIALDGASATAKEGNNGGGKGNGGEMGTATLGTMGTPEITGAVGIEGTRAVIMVPRETTELQGVPGTMETAEATAAQVG